MNRRELLRGLALTPVAAAPLAATIQQVRAEMPPEPEPVCVGPGGGTLHITRTQKDAAALGEMLRMNGVPCASVFQPLPRTVLVSMGGCVYGFRAARIMVWQEPNGPQELRWFFEQALLRLWPMPPVGQVFLPVSRIEDLQERWLAVRDA